MKVWMDEQKVKTIKKAMIDKDLRQFQIRDHCRVSLGRPVTNQNVWDVIHGRIKDSEIRQLIQVMLGLDPSIWN